MSSKPAHTHPYFFAWHTLSPFQAVHIKAVNSPETSIALNGGFSQVVLHIRIVYITILLVESLVFLKLRKAIRPLWRFLFLFSTPHWWREAGTYFEHIRVSSMTKHLKFHTTNNAAAGMTQ